MHELNMLVFLLCTQIFVEVNKSKIDGHIEFLHELAMLQNACFVFLFAFAESNECRWR